MVDFVSISYCQFNRQKDFLIGQSFNAAAHKLSMFQITPLSFSFQDSMIFLTTSFFALFRHTLGNERGSHPMNPGEKSVRLSGNING